MKPVSKYLRIILLGSSRWNDPVLHFIIGRMMLSPLTETYVLHSTFGIKLNFEFFFIESTYSGVI